MYTGYMYMYCITRQWGEGGGWCGTGPNWAIRRDVGVGGGGEISCRAVSVPVVL